MSDQTLALNLSNDPESRLFTKVAIVSVAFARTSGVIATLEGDVNYNAGDAVITGKLGDQWPVSLPIFHHRYIPVYPTVMGHDGKYRNRGIAVRAKQVDKSFNVSLSNHENSVIVGKAGDWLVQYGDDSLGVVADYIFKETYRPILNVDGACKTAGRIHRFFVRNVILLGWRPKLWTGFREETSQESMKGQLVVEDSLPEWQESFKEADSISNALSGCTRDTYTVLYICSVLAIFFAIINLGLRIAEPYGLIFPILEGTSLLTVLYTYRRAHHKSWHQKWMALRYHTEYLRYLPLLASLTPDALKALFGVQSEPATPDINRIDHNGVHTEMQIIFDAIVEEAQFSERQRLLDKTRHQISRQSPVLLDDYAREIARSQAEYHHLTIQRESEIQKRVVKLSNALFWLSILVVVIHLFISHESWLTVLAVMLPTLATMLRAFANHEGGEVKIIHSSYVLAGTVQWLNVSSSQPPDTNVLLKLLLEDVLSWRKVTEGSKIHLG